ncbi:MAG TPA: TIM barrel protein [Terriglobales bacterium]|jgi:hydroxypyruvate isomerase
MSTVGIGGSLALTKMGAAGSRALPGIALADELAPPQQAVFLTPDATPPAQPRVTLSQQRAFDSLPYPEKGNDVKPAPRKGRIKQGVTRGVFEPVVPGQRGPSPGEMDFEEMCRQAVRLGIKGFDLVGPADWPILKKYGLVSSMIYGVGIGAGGRRGPSRGNAAAGARSANAAGRGRGGRPAGPKIIEKDAHDHFVQVYSDTIDLAAQNGFPNIILTTGSRGNVTDEEGADALVALLNSLKARAEDKGVTLCTELISSNQKQPLEDRYMGDHGAWLFGVMQRVSSPRAKVLYDIFHAQVMDGNIVNHIRDNWQWIGHFHTGGNPPVSHVSGPRNELDCTQEFYWPFVMMTIADMGFTDYVSHEYRPAPGMDPIASLEKCIRICDA